jgi:hypothetical protein
MTAPAGYSGTPLPTKLGIAARMRVAVLHAPDGFDARLGALPADVRLQHGLRKTDRVDLVIGFVTERAHLERNIGWLVTTLPPAGALWVAWPGRAAKVPTDMTEDVVREVALPLGWVDTEVCAIDDVWSGLRLVLRKELRTT